MQLEMPIGRGLPETKRRAHDGPAGLLHCGTSIRSVPRHVGLGSILLKRILRGVSEQH